MAVLRTRKRETRYYTYFISPIPIGLCLVSTPLPPNRGKQPMDWGLGASAIKLDSILGHISLGSIKFPSRVLEGKIDVFVAGKGLRKPLDEKEWRYGSVSNTLNRKFCKLDFGKILAKNLMKIPC